MLYNSGIFQHAADSLKSDREFVKKLVEQHADSLNHADPFLIQDNKFVEELKIINPLVKKTVLLKHWTRSA